jgi:hypothetical protein
VKPTKRHPDDGVKAHDNGPALAKQFTNARARATRTLVSIFDGQGPVDPIRRAASSGHGVGKSVMVAFDRGPGRVHPACSPASRISRLSLPFSTHVLKIGRRQPLDLPCRREKG